LTYDETATYDLKYVQKHSVLTDFQILLRTAMTVLRGSGAR
jgi:lipopolysaccharide/colanic/teichoic acid biosynthesis glycosyltransferase